MHIHPPPYHRYPRATPLVFTPLAPSRAECHAVLENCREWSICGDADEGWCATGKWVDPAGARTTQLRFIDVRLRHDNRNESPTWALRAGIWTVRSRVCWQPADYTPNIVEAWCAMMQAITEVAPRHVPPALLETLERFAEFRPHLEWMQASRYGSLAPTYLREPAREKRYALRLHLLQLDRAPL